MPRRAVPRPFPRAGEHDGRGPADRAAPRNLARRRVAVFVRPGAVLVRRPTGAGDRRLQLLLAGQASRTARCQRTGAGRCRGRAASRCSSDALRVGGRPAGPGRRRARARSPGGRRGLRRGTARRLVDEEGRRPFNLRNAAPFRATLLRLGDDDHIFQIVVHHIVSDERSKIVLFDELSTLYAAYREGLPSTLPEPGLQLADFAEWQRSRLTEDALSGELAHWVGELAGLPASFDLPADRPRPSIASLRGGKLRLAAPGGPPGVAAGVRPHRGRHVLRRHPRVVQGLAPPLHGTRGLRRRRTRRRPHPGRARGHGRRPPRHVCRAQRSRGAAEFPRAAPACATAGPRCGRARGPPLRAARPRAPAGARPEPASALPGAVRDQPGRARAALPWNRGGGGGDRGGRRRGRPVPLLQEVDGGFDALWEYSTDLFDPRDGRADHRHFVSLLRAAVAEPDRSVGELAMLTPEEREQLLAASQGRRKEYWSVPIHALVERQAARTPGEIAVDFEGVQLTYAELDARANQLARHLQQLGVSKGSLVGISLDRSLELAVGLLAILKAGGAYVPLDPELPAGRFAFMLEDSGADVILTQDHLREAAVVRRSRGRSRLELAGDRNRENAIIRASRSARTTSRTSSTPPVRPASRRACSTPTGASSTGCSRCRTPTASARRTACCRRPRRASTCRCARSSGRSSSARAWSSQRPASTGTRRTSPS